MQETTNFSIEKPGLQISGNKKFKGLVEGVQNLLEPIFRDVEEAQEVKKGYKMKKTQFLGAHPLSLEQKYITELVNNAGKYLVCEKTDGVRFLMYITNFGEVILSGRDNDYYLVNLPITEPLVSSRDDDMKLSYIFDGELVLDKIKGEEQVNYLLFDCIVHNKTPVFRENYDVRLNFCHNFATLQKETLKMLDKGIKLVQVEQAKKMAPIKVFVKDFFGVENTMFIMKNLVPKLPHENDGLIFTKIDKPYPVGPTDSIIKWKPPHLNTVDFLAVNNPQYIEEFGKRIVDLYTIRWNKEKQSNDYVLFDVMVVSEEDFDKIGEVTEIQDFIEAQAYKNKEDRAYYIVECKYDSTFTDELLTNFLYKCLNDDSFKYQIVRDSVLSSNMEEDSDIMNQLSLALDKKVKGMKGNWVMTKRRTDKNLPNAFTTAKNVFNCIFENITSQILEQKLSAVINPQIGHDRPAIQDGPLQKKVRY